MPHASHIIQPLNQQPFASLKRQYAAEIRRYDPDGAGNITRADFDILWANARGAMTPDVIRSGWRRAGLYP